jgi:hypothetical protein
LRRKGLSKRRIPLIATIDDPPVVQRVLAHGLPSARDAPPPPTAMPGARAEQWAEPYERKEPAPPTRATADVCPATTRHPRGECPLATSRLRFDLRDALGRDRREMLCYLCSPRIGTEPGGTSR